MYIKAYPRLIPTSLTDKFLKVIFLKRNPFRFRGIMLYFSQHFYTALGLFLWMVPYHLHVYYQYLPFAVTELWYFVCKKHKH
jgi:hypothetical protein